MSLKDLIYHGIDRFYSLVSQIFENRYPIRKLREAQKRIKEVEYKRDILKQRINKLEALLQERDTTIESLEKDIEMKNGLIGHLKQENRNYRNAVLDILQNYVPFTAQQIARTKEPVIILDYEGKIVAASDSAKKLLGRKNLEGLDYRALIHVDEEDEQEFSEFMNNLEKTRAEVVVNQPDRRRFGLRMIKYSSPPLDISYLHLNLPNTYIVPFVVIRARGSKKIIKRRFEREIRDISEKIDEIIRRFRSENLGLEPT